ncbi:hypothetical protein EMIHUDRAFT_114385 [Emiliania huxleyi CCMP1516]|uniref:Sulfotransferase domain-containing protein n=2 Tax=Emiliania huxleyi TaxID=2903 RepID=A0A0D3JX16_EMIH1|nr:hypothetical protein EMIHUDRAFT_114385 [Emiliania huxleyi CCMP1516]EOD28051.1 hypothetical protein EMIHUDRAFT_114385 [Emiliania huxleyi CCMP1516]|eukprot:XP_005780480.1 hypothetical protein EMIHUDRAFT_114385 [Emiliania huxleyi CCMP1516]
MRTVGAQNDARKQHSCSAALRLALRATRLRARVRSVAALAALAALTALAALAARTTLNDQVQDPDPRGLVAWISFGKVGSSTMRVLLKRRAVRHGWQDFVPGVGWVGREFAMSPNDNLICHAKGSRLAQGMDETSVAKLAPPPCADAPDGYVVQTDYGYCEAVAPRPCRYLTILREPISRVVSAYNYFCLSCEEGGMQCVKNESNRAAAAASNAMLPLDAHGLPLAMPQAACPHMSIVEYALWSGDNYYVRRLACAKAGACNAVHEEGRHAMGAADLEVAVRRLEQPEMLVVFTEELSTLAISAIETYLDDELPLTANSNVHAHRFTPNATELQQLGSMRVLGFDVKLYRTLWAREHGSPEGTSTSVSPEAVGRRLMASEEVQRGEARVRLMWPADGFVLRL